MHERAEKSAPCPLCRAGSTQRHPGYQHVSPGDWSLRSCSECGIAFIHPMPDSRTLAGYYDRAYYGRNEGKFVGPVERIVGLFRYLRAKAVRDLVPSGRILDVGCGRGIMLALLKTWGYEVHGVELDTVAAARARKNLDQPVSHSLEEIQHGETRPFQAVSFWHSLEHMPHPGETLRMVNDLLAPGGLLIIAAPHMGSIQSRLAKTSWLHLDLPRHLIHFDMNRLADFLKTKGYEVVRHDHFSLEYNVIDTLCHLYRVIGFPPLFPFDLIRNVRPSNSPAHTRVLPSVVGACLLVPLGALAFLLTCAFSAVRSGSTTTLFLRKR